MNKTTSVKPKTMGIGELARRAGVSPRTVRYYEELGLLQSERRVPEKHRRYTDSQLVALRLIRRARLLGLSLAQIKELNDVYRQDMSETRVIQRSSEILRSYLDRLEVKQREMGRYHDMLVSEIARLEKLLQR